MAKMSACLQCQQHYFRNEAACPHCGASTPAANPLAGMSKRVRMGGLMLFTALTTTACYGVPAPVGPQGPTKAPTAVERVPTQVNRGNLFVTPKGGTRTSRVVTLESAILNGNRINIKGNGLDILIEAMDDTVFKPFTGVKEALPVEKMKNLWVTVSDQQVGSPSQTYTFAAPGDKAPMGSLQLSNFDETNVSGHLKLEVDGTLMELYFSVQRSTQ
jgi:hypothetical protein